MDAIDRNLERIRVALERSALRNRAVVVAWPAPKIDADSHMPTKQRMQAEEVVAIKTADTNSAGKIFLPSEPAASLPKRDQSLWQKVMQRFGF